VLVYLHVRTNQAVRKKPRHKVYQYSTTQQCAVPTASYWSKRETNTNPVNKTHSELSVCLSVARSASCTDMAQGKKVSLYFLFHWSVTSGAGDQTQDSGPRLALRLSNNIQCCCVGLSRCYDPSSSCRYPHALDKTITKYRQPTASVNKQCIYVYVYTHTYIHTYNASYTFRTDNNSQTESNKNKRKNLTICLWY
jgi:hypothetical protein